LAVWGYFYFNFELFRSSWLADVSYLSQHLFHVGPQILSIFREAGNESHFSLLQQSFESNTLRQRNLNQFDPLALGKLLKKILNEHEPLFTFDLYSSLIEAQDRQMGITRQNTLKQITSQLPESNRTVLISIFRILSAIERNKSVTGMNSTALGIAFGPSLLRPLKLDLPNMQKQGKLVSALCEVFISKYGSILGNEEITSGRASPTEVQRTGQSAVDYFKMDQNNVAAPQDTGEFLQIVQRFSFKSFRGKYLLILMQLQ